MLCDQLQIIEFGLGSITCGSLNRKSGQTDEWTDGWGTWCRKFDTGHWSRLKPGLTQARAKWMWILTSWNVHRHHFTSPGNCFYSDGSICVFRNPTNRNPNKGTHAITIEAVTNNSRSIYQLWFWSCCSSLSLEYTTCKTHWNTGLECKSLSWKLKAQNHFSFLHSLWYT